MEAVAGSRVVAPQDGSPGAMLWHLQLEHVCGVPVLDNQQKDPELESLQSNPVAEAEEPACPFMIRQSR